MLARLSSPALPCQHGACGPAAPGLPVPVSSPPPLVSAAQGLSTGRVTGLGIYAQGKCQNYTKILKACCTLSGSVYPRYGLLAVFGLRVVLITLALLWAEKLGGPLDQALACPVGLSVHWGVPRNCAAAGASREGSRLGRPSGPGSGPSAGGARCPR